MISINRLFENNDTTFISFIHNDSKITINGINPTEVYTNLIDWLSINGYDFPIKIHDTKTRKLYSFKEASNFEITKFHKIKNIGKYIPKSSLFLGGNVEIKLNNMKIMLNEFGVDLSSLEHSGFTGREKKYTDSDDSNNHSSLEAAQLILKNNNNKPMTLNEIWEEVEKMNISGFAKHTLSSRIGKYTINSGHSDKSDNPIFKIVEGTRPYKYFLLNPDEIQDVEEDDLDFEEGPPSSTSRIRRFDLEDELSKAQAQAEFDDEVQSFKRFRSIHDSDIDTFKRKKGENPFKQALCILGDSGAGKSYTTEQILANEGHEFKFIIPTASSTGLLSQFSPSENKYILSKLGIMLKEAADNPYKLYTAVFDEFHKPSTIEMINDELLQAISTKRNKFRFVSLDSETTKLYEDSNLEIVRGNIKIPDNFGFIFISSKPKVISNNPDLFRRLDFVRLEKEDQGVIKNIDQLLSKKLTQEELSTFINLRED